MLLKSMLVSIDGSKYSQIAADYGFWLANNLGAKLDGQHVVDPRLVDLFLEPEFAASLGFGRSVDSMEKVIEALRKMGQLILNLFGDQAAVHAMTSNVYLDEGYVVNEILRRGEEFDLIIVGHRGRGSRKLPQEGMIGAVAERIAIGSKKPVLVAVNPLDEMQEILVGFDGSEPSIGALRMAEALASETGKPLRALYVAKSEKQMAEAHMAVEQGQTFLLKKWDQEIFSIKQGMPSHVLLEEARQKGSLVVLGAYGFRDPNEVVMGSTATYVIRHSQTSVLVYR